MRPRCHLSFAGIRVTMAVDGVISPLTACLMRRSGLQVWIFPDRFRPRRTCRRTNSSEYGTSSFELALQALVAHQREGPSSCPALWLPSHGEVHPHIAKPKAVCRCQNPPEACIGKDSRMLQQAGVSKSIYIFCSDTVADCQHLLRCCSVFALQAGLPRRIDIRSCDGEGAPELTKLAIAALRRLSSLSLSALP